MKRFFLFTAMLLAFQSHGQNVGIGISNPTAPLSFANLLGNKIVFWGDANGPHYGMGIQSTTLQIYADYNTSNIAFGYGRSGNFTERARINNTGFEGMFLNGRLHLRSGEPNNSNAGGGVWLYNPANTATIGFMGTQNNQNIGFYGGPAGWGFTYDIINSRVGIGNPNPNAPLSFPATLGKKITLYPGATGDVGIGVAGNRLYLYGDNPNADVAFGYDAAGVFNEKFAVKPTGAIAVSGNTGTIGQLLVSKGSGTPASWETITPVSDFRNAGFNGTQVRSGNNLSVDLPNLTLTVTVPEGKSGRLFVSCGIFTNGIGCIGLGCIALAYLEMFVDGVQRGVRVPVSTAVNEINTATLANVYAQSVAPGVHTITFRATKNDANVYELFVNQLYSSCYVLFQ